jgi:hypothetical protein
MNVRIAENLLRMASERLVQIARRGTGRIARRIGRNRERSARLLAFATIVASGLALRVGNFARSVWNTCVKGVKKTTHITLRRLKNLVMLRGSNFAWKSLMPTVERSVIAAGKRRFFCFQWTTSTTMERSTGRSCPVIPVQVEEQSFTVGYARTIFQQAIR